MQIIILDVNKFKNAVRQLKHGRAAGSRGIFAELTKCGSERLFNQRTWCINQYLIDTLLPEEWNETYIYIVYP